MRVTEIANDNRARLNQEKSVYDKVIESGTIRASYANYPPYCLKNPNTGVESEVLLEGLSSFFG